MEINARKELIRVALRMVLFERRDMGDRIEDPEARREQDKADVDEEYELLLAFDDAAKEYVKALELSGH